MVKSFTQGKENNYLYSLVRLNYLEATAGRRFSKKEIVAVTENPYKYTNIHNNYTKVTVKVKVMSLCLTMHHAVKAYGGM